MNKFCLCILVGYASVYKLSEVSGQTTFDAEFRPRVEYRQGFRKPLADTLKPAFITLQRTRLYADYKGKVLNARISLQDARIWGNTDNKINSSKIEIYEAWFEYLVCSGFSMQMGRQPLKYDDQRLLAAPNWSNTGTAHDILLLKLNLPFIQIHSGLAYNNSNDTLMNTSYSYAPRKNYKTMGFLWISRSIYKDLKISAISIYEGLESKSDYEMVYPRFTYGGNLTLSSDSSAFGGTLTAYLQTGKDPNKSVGKSYADLKSYFLAAKVSYKFLDKVTASLGLDYYSGSNADIDADKSNTFNRLYGVTHSFNGSMEYFVTLPNQGLIDYYASLNFQITPKISLDLAEHLFYFDKDFIYNKVKAEKNLGSETDLTVNYKVSKEIAFQGGFSKYFNSSSTKKYFKMQNTDIYPQQWAYLMITVRPQFYKTPPATTSK
jgi:hypothetical protein